MLSVLALGTARLAPTEKARDTDPGLIALAIRAFESLRNQRQVALESRVASFIEANGSHLSDDVERRIGTGVLSGQI